MPRHCAGCSLNVSGPCSSASGPSAARVDVGGGFFFLVFLVPDMCLVRGGTQCVPVEGPPMLYEVSESILEIFLFFAARIL